MKPISVILLLVIFFSGASIGLFVGQKTAPKPQQMNCVPASHDDLDSFYTKTLEATGEQRQLLAPIEKEYLIEKQTYIDQMAAANHKLADILEQKGYEDPEVAGVVMEIHRAMGSLQHLTLQHLARVKSVLTPEQAERLKDHVVMRLRQNP
ncbi:Spy/CpxP family protein refolding chaperone [Desulforhopalus sp. IMCC35007]|uniref:Spy/CpxP family protein refolding chaperone n=1 Tax=Desulforhopalus sp. IMCC35007 TaxID=2569543 RepID=UPI0010ADEECD|nr:periplasmic heavy metal sensor [Desulforhopalus sp. IMCC35007]TKB10792.1 periplasmic heavy metal sensor [Desulforhopalus sp. IMCC35007]